MNKRIALLITVILSMALLCGCSKEEEVPVVTKQPVLGEDVVGYAGFPHLQAYTMTGEDGTVVYLPASESAYVGGTCVISKTQGVEVTINQDPMFSDDIASKPVKQKLSSALDASYSATFTKGMIDLERSGVSNLDNGGVFEEISYLFFDDNNKQYVSYWIGNYYIILEDGREFQAAISVNSGEKTGETQAVLSELEQYFGIPLPYDEAAMQAKLDSYNPDEDELARMNGETVDFGAFKLYLPEGFSKNGELNSVLKMFMQGAYEQFEIYSKGDLADSWAIFTGIAKDSDGFNVSAEAGALSEGQIKLLEKLMNEQVKQAFPEAKNSELEIIGQSQLGFAMRVYIYEQKGFDGYFYYIYRGEYMYFIGGLMNAENTEEEKQEVYDSIDRMYSSMEVK